ncbi:hypothetical protein HNI00_16195 [Thermoleptolyngbya oregonensis NK1-22]|uniref:Uncharacterized protein n=1 Tax=Thermoleptolyngbya oregonensis NK1-22 TaxID=2547457 RepID=A0AA97BAI4_9CYAN|nr:hypothetical protein [Thermoleptolyngbya oregonensis]WOB44515.1 hypothetical protein HNI00_16195 [Thermoleptolyngbya oregonensis NK1-22]
MYQYEFETLDRELESEFESAVLGESDRAYEYEYESEEFLPLLAPILKAAAPMAIQAIGGLFRRRRRRGQREFEMEFETPLNEFELEGEYEGDPFIGNLLRGLGSAFGGDGEFEYEFEQHPEALPEFETAPASEYEVMAEHLAHMAANSQSEAEAEAFIGALIPMVARGISAAAPVISRVVPQVIRPLAQAGRALLQNPQTRPLVRTFPTIARSSLATLAQRVAKGQPVNARVAARTVAGNVAQVLGNPRRASAVMKRSRQIHSRQCTCGARKRARI